MTSVMGWIQNTDITRFGRGGSSDTSCGAQGTAYNKMDSLRSLGFVDPRQIVDALAHPTSKGDVERAAALLRDGVVADVEQGYSNESTATYKCFLIKRFRLEGDMHKNATRMCMAENGLSFWPKEGGACLGYYRWHQIRAFSLSNTGSIFTMENNVSKEPIRIYSDQAATLMEAAKTIVFTLAASQKRSRTAVKRGG